MLAVDETSITKKSNACSCQRRQLYKGNHYRHCCDSRGGEEILHKALMF